MLKRSSKIGIVGLGLLGGSYAKGFYNAGYQVVGIDIDEETIEYARNMRWIVEGGSDPSLISDCDVVIFAVYPKIFVQWIKDNQQYLKSGIIISDVTGIKRGIVSEINSILREDVEFIACHPMAGREYKGIRYADCKQFESSNYIIVPTENNSEEAIALAEDIGRVLKFQRISQLRVEDHDRIIGFVSQLCHVIAISLMNLSEDPRLVDYTGDSFRDLTRIANINETLWPELFIFNKDYLIEEVNALIAQMNVLKGYIEEENIPEMQKLMIEATERRKAFGKR